MKPQAPGGNSSGDYALLASQLAELAEAARQGDMDRIEALRAAHEALMTRLQAHRADLRAHPDAGRIATDMSAALASIEAAMPLLETLRDKARGDADGARMQRKVSQSYR
jgi:hypothetical protein